ncbi:hypothetical protein MUN89_02695 [Halobacillus salinarum]|uniref:Phosphoribulokinase/uridine kinase domain-containing protein n=1 Tax=Halobacillus salinarum TaxID=2932257 RepID=A0ABY4EKC1_9BACI|nr:hypothetical protein [Halobacillus salinarum]UOQ44880.1 hypothetical protein MUN89_02695 [Halobacillus salinarum]
MKRKSPMVIAIAAVSGGGKTTIASCLKGKLPNSKTIYFDDYDFDGPKDIIKWIDNGCNPDDWDLSPLIRDIKQLLSEPLDYIILDFPFAYLHSKTSSLIDFTVFIDTPLDIAMARRINRDFKSGSSEDIILDLDNYLARGRQGYITMLDSTKPNSDLIVDGTLPKFEVAGIITQKVMNIE